MGVAEWFKNFCENIQIKNADLISCRCKAITKRLNTDFWATDSETTHSLYVGSYGRSTAIHDTSDVDTIFRLPYSIYKQYNQHIGNGQSALLQAVRTSIKKKYSTTDIGANGQIVEVPFNDGITFELLPVFANKNGSYTHPDSNEGGAWKITNPKPEINAIRERNDECNKNLVRLCRMMRAWKTNKRVPISGLLIDTLAYQFIGNWKYRYKSYFYYDFMCRDFFNYLATQDKEKEWWNAPGSGQRVYPSKAPFQNKAKQCYHLSLDAIQHEMVNNQNWSAKQKWRDIFGTSFPL